MSQQTSKITEGELLISVNDLKKQFDEIVGQKDVTILDLKNRLRNVIERADILMSLLQLEYDHHNEMSDNGIEDGLDLSKRFNIAVDKYNQVKIFAQRKYAEDLLSCHCCDFDH